MRFSFSLILTVIFCGYVIHTIWTLAGIFIPPTCKDGERCYSSYLSRNPDLNLIIYTSVKMYPSKEPNRIHTATKLDYRNLFTINLMLIVPHSTRNNGTMYMHVALLDNKSLYKSYEEIVQTENFHTLPLIVHMVPQASTFSLLVQHSGKETKNKQKKRTDDDKLLPYSHITTEVPLSILTDDLKMPSNAIPGELYPYIRIRNGKFLPIIQHNILKSRLTQYKPLNSSTTEVPVTVTVSPISYGSLRLMLNMKLAIEQMQTLGFGLKDVDDVKGIFADANLYLLSATVLIASFHILFDFLAFKNDVSFWRRTSSLAGLSARTVVWRAVSQSIVFLYLWDEQTSLLVLVPSGISALIEIWKVTKVLHLRIVRTGWKVRIYRDVPPLSETKTALADAEAMRYLSMLLYPLCIAGAIYSLIYEPHKSWYSWALRSTVNGVYAFGFLFMLPQLFVNYRLRSVAALPWRAFMYKAFNTFIDDVFAFLIVMPTAHRVACFRDDIVFLVYLYQRWLYPVDASRRDTGASMDVMTEEMTNATNDKKND